MTNLVVNPDDDIESGRVNAIEQQIDATRSIRERVTHGLSNLFEDIMREFNAGTTTPEGNRKRPLDIEEFDKITKLLLKSMGDTDKVDLVRLRIEADKGMNNDNIAAARARSSELLLQLGRQVEHPGAVELAVIEGVSERIVTKEERDARLGLTQLDNFKDVEFSPGVLIQGRVEENSDAFYARLRALSNQAVAAVEVQDPDQEYDN